MQTVIARPYRRMAPVPNKCKLVVPRFLSREQPAIPRLWDGVYGVTKGESITLPSNNLVCLISSRGIALLDAKSKKDKL